MSSRRPGAPRPARRPVGASGQRRFAPRTGSTPSGTSRAGSTSRSGSTRSGARSRPSTSARRRGPAAAARPARTSPRGPEQEAPGITITRRTLALVALVVVALAALVPTVNSYVTQRQQLSELEAEVAAKEREVEDLRAQVARWEDPAYVAARARERLLFAMPGETQYRLTDTSGRDVPLTAAQQAEEQRADAEWFTLLWESVEGSSRLTPQDIPDEPESTDEEER
ncbi:septum formation initiator family protein [Brachybacterium sp. Marseille-Q7125]|uniref:FtsB family cell division protein n=1 Tax=Brachybacterium sp. Marseille-Q7125 TaxID=2932815 RepID=UPI001FF53ADE|nr:septum formation initiator family protein [Brachybacterium sp. Marseille-Q7125]